MARMNKFYLLLLSAFSLVLSAAAQQAKPNNDALLLKESTFDFGKIPQGKPVTHDFVIVNKGKTPLMIENVEASCGCTTPEWSQEAIPAGGQSVIKVGFNASSEGPFKKPISVNYSGGLLKTLVISGEVYRTPTTSAPLNPSLSLLKQ